ncbi:hypothetical protein [Shinella sp. M31]|uniref:hypothetical protein n=1 Tax=Shinella sp. M31 TaxID=3368615 RepID=UPI003B9F0AE6
MAGVWVITKYDGVEEIWKRELKERDFTIIQIRHVIERLACTDLTSEEVMDSIDPALETNHLKWNEEDGVISGGENPHYVAKYRP